MIDFPDINGPLLSGRSRERMAGYAEQPRTAGPSLIVPTGDTGRDFYNVSFRFTTKEAATFEQWLEDNELRSNRQAFNLPIRIEDPHAPTQEVVFTVDGYPQLTSQTLGTYTYSAQVMIDQTKSEDLDNAEFVYELGGFWPSGDFTSGALVFDEAINLAWPEA